MAVPYIAYLPEKGRICMLVSGDYPHEALLLFSDDRGTTWGEPRPVASAPTLNASAGLGTALAYLGGWLTLVAGEERRLDRGVSHGHGAAAPGQD